MPEFIKLINSGLSLINDYERENGIRIIQKVLMRRILGKNWVKNFWDHFLRKHIETFF